MVSETRYIVGGRRSGKTYDSIQYLRTHSTALMVSATERIADFARQEYPDVANRIVGPHKYHLLDHRGEIVVDNVELLLTEILGRVPAVITGTGVATTPYNELWAVER